MLTPVLDAFPGLSVLVIGDALLDDYLHGSPTRLSREAPVPQVQVEEHEAVPGGAGNVAANLAALGAEVRFLTVFGDDPDAAVLRRALERRGVGTGDAVVEPGRRTVAKRRVVAFDQIVMRFDEGAPADVAADVTDVAVQRLGELYPACDAVVVSDYGYGTVTDALVDALADLVRADPRVVVVDAKDCSRFRRVAPTAVTPNHAEFLALLERLPPPSDVPDLPDPADPVDRADRSDRAAHVAARCADLHELTGARVAAVTLDREGTVLCEQGRPAYRTWTRPAPDSRACGAGDSYTAALACALAAGADVPQAGEIAQAAGSVVTARSGTATCTLDDLREHLAETKTPLEPADAVRRRVEAHRRQGRRVVFTNGCFDLLHRGHIDLLNRAKAMGDVLVVALNSDAGIARLKGPARPINPLEDRARVLAALSAVDHLVAFDGTTADDLVLALRPDVYVKGGDYTEQMVPEAAAVHAVGGQVRIVPYLEDRSTSALIERIRHETAAPGAAGR